LHFRVNGEGKRVFGLRLGGKWSKGDVGDGRGKSR